MNPQLKKCKRLLASVDEEGLKMLCELCIHVIESPGHDEFRFNTDHERINRNTTAGSLWGEAPFCWPDIFEFRGFGRIEVRAKQSVKIPEVKESAETERMEWLSITRIEDDHLFTPGKQMGEKLSVWATKEDVIDHIISFIRQRIKS